MTPAEIRAARLSLGLTQNELAQAMGLRGNATISEWETGARNPSRQSIAQLRALVEQHGKGDAK